MHFLTYAYLPHHRASCLDSFLFTLPIFYIIFIYLQPNFHSVFCLVFLHLITEFELNIYDISSRQSQVRALNFCSFTVWLASISVQPRVSKNKPKEDHQLHCPLFKFCFVSYAMPTSFLFGFPFHFDYRHAWGVSRDFYKPIPLKLRFPIFHSRTFSFCCHPFFFIRTLKTIAN